jgi:hypothetical protein
MASTQITVTRELGASARRIAPPRWRLHQARLPFAALAVKPFDPPFGLDCVRWNRGSPSGRPVPMENQDGLASVRPERSAAEPPATGRRPGPRPRPGHAAGDHPPM